MRPLRFSLRMLSADYLESDFNRACRNNVGPVMCAYLSYVSYVCREDGLTYYMFSSARLNILL